MKRYGFTVVMALVLAGLIGYLYLVEFPTEQAKTKQDTQDKTLLPFDQGEITGLSIHSQNEDIALDPGDGGTWKLTAPIRADADVREVSSLIRALVLGKIARVVEEQPSALDTFGLDKPTMVVTVKAGARKETISIGDIGPISSTLYAMRDSDKKVLLTDLAAKDFLNKRLFTFRRKEVVRVDPSQTERLRLVYPKTEIVLYRTDEMDQSRRNKWVIRSPIEAPADPTEVRMLLTRLDDVKALGFIDPGPERDALLKTLKEPTAAITAYVKGKEQVVKFYQPAPGSGEAYAVTTPDDPIYRVSPSIVTGLTKDVFGLRDKRLLGFDTSEIAMLAVKAGTESYVLIHQNGTWVLEAQPDEPVDQQKADVFVSRVVNLPAELAVQEKQPTSTYGLAAPSAEFTATGKDGKKHKRLVLGSRTGGLVYVSGDGMPGVYQARADLLTQIPSMKDLLTKDQPNVSGPALPGSK
jgi:hypothetical protein